MKDLINTFTDIFETPCVLAGGCVRDTLLGRTPKDFDLFIPNQAFESFKEYREEFLAKFNDKLSRFERVKAVVGWHKSEPFLVESLMFDGKEVQLLATPKQTIKEITSDFDWNVCLFGFDGEKYHYENSDLEGIKEGEYLRLNKCTFPYSTLRRGYRFSERFKMRLHTTDIQAICQQILDGEREKN